VDLSSAQWFVVSVLKLDNDQLNYMAAPQRKAATKQSSAPE
jgi:hypothetical protein